MKNTNTIWVGLSFLVVGLTLGLILTGPASFFGQADVVLSDETDQEMDLDALVDQLEFVSVSVDDDAVLGSADAPVTIVEFSDFQCPYCAKFRSETFDLIKENYIDTGLVNFVYRDFPLPSHGEANLAAQAAECVGANSDELYYQMHDALFDTVEQWAYNEEAKSIIFGLASNLGVDISSCIENQEMADEVNADYTAGRGYGISGTPTFFINGKKIVGAYPYQVFEAIIESQL